MISHRIGTMRVKLIPLILLLTTGLPMVATAHDANDHYDRVNLSASAQTQVENDIVIAVLYSEEEGNNPVLLADLVNQRIGEAITQVKRHDTIKLQTNSYTTHPIYNNNKIIGWRVRQSIRLESRGMALMSILLGDLQQSLSLQQVSFAVSPELKNSTDDRLIAEALRVFEQRAGNIIRQLGRRDYKIVDLNISTTANRPVPRHFEMATMSTSRMSAPAIESGEQTLQVTVNGQIEME